MYKYRIYWVRDDKQGDVFMGEYDTEAEAEAALPGAKKKFADLGGDDSSGFWCIDRMSSDRLLSKFRDMPKTAKS